MNSEPPSRKLHLEIQIDTANPNLLEGLETWLRLGLISEQQVKQLCQQYLSCTLTEHPATAAIQNTNRLKPIPSINVVVEEEIAATTSRTRTNPIQNLITQVLTSFREELSLRWLLFLGLFLVIVSSGVLAATQWQKFPPVGQYLILWLYTLTFWIIGFWAKRQENLLLTSQTLQNIALFLIPINFWAMDTFNLREDNIGVVIIAIASLSLLNIVFSSRQTNYGLLGQLNYLILNGLHWIWRSGMLFPIPAIYIGTILTATNLTFFQNKRSQEQVEIEKTIFSKTLLIYGLSILLVRGIFFLKLPLALLGLSIAISGWLLRKQTEEETTVLDKILDIVGFILIFLGWWVAITNNAAWQALAISGLGLHYFWRRLERSWKRVDLLFLFLIGFQSLFHIRDVIPVTFRETVNNAWMQFSQTSNYSLSIYSVTFFPYILLWVGLTSWLHRQERQKLVRLGEGLSLGLGICLTALSLETIVGRSLNLLLSTGTLAYLVSNRPLRVPLIYFTHLIGLLTIVSWIDWWFPSLSLIQWGYFLILLTAGEWLNSLRYQPSSRRNKKQWWYLSSWRFGFILAVASFLVFLSSLSTYFATGNKQSSVLAWLIVPACLTIIAIVTRKKRSRQAALISSYGFVFAQLLTLWQPGIRLISLGVSAGVMLINSFYYKHPITARLPIELMLVLGIAWIWERYLVTTNINSVLLLTQWVLWDGIYITILWLARDWLKQKTNRLAKVYTFACDQVATVLCVFELIRLSIHAGGVALGEFNSGWQWIVTAILIVFSLVYRFWREPKEIAVYGLLATLEILITECVFGLQGTAITAATVNLIFALIIFVLTNRLFNRFPRYSHLTSLQISPLLFALMVIIWRLSYFTAYTGLLTLGVAIIGLCVSSRFPQNKWLMYLSLIGITLALNEVIIYQLWKSLNFLYVNELISLSLVQIGIAFIYRFLVWQSRLRRLASIQHISLQTLEKIADGHWAIAILFKIIVLIDAGFLTTHFFPSKILFGCTLLVPTYALLKARHSSLNNKWIYLGCADIYITAIFARWIWRQLETLDPSWGLIAASIAFIIYHLPWQNWGWMLKPWRNISYCLPLITAILTLQDISYISLFTIAAFYIYLAFHQRTIRWSYVTVVILDWIILRFLEEQNLTDVLYYASVIGLTALYFAQVEPNLKKPENRKIRHYFRILGSSIINVSALVFHQETGLTPGIISLFTVLIGLGIKIRAFLFVGTITFILTVFYQLIVLNFQYTQVKWSVGLIVGILLILIAANFERRREQMLNLLRNWLEQLNRWQ